MNDRINAAIGAALADLKPVVKQQAQLSERIKKLHALSGQLEMKRLRLERRIELLKTLKLILLGVEKETAKLIQEASTLETEASATDSKSRSSYCAKEASRVRKLVAESCAHRFVTWSPSHTSYDYDGTSWVRGERKCLVCLHRERQRNDGGRDEEYTNLPSVYGRLVGMNLKDWFPGEPNPFWTPELRKLEAELNSGAACNPECPQDQTGAVPRT